MRSTEPVDVGGRTGVWRAAALSLRAAPLHAAASIVLTAGMAVQGPTIAVLLGVLTTDLVAARWADAVAPAVALGGVLAAGLAVTWAAFGVRAVLEEKTLATVDERVLHRIATLPGLAAFEQPQLMDELATLRRDRVRLGNVLVVLMTMAGAGIQLLLTVVLLVRVSPLLGLVPALGLAPLLCGRYAERVRQASLDRAAQAQRLAGEWARIGVSPGLAAELAVTGMDAQVRAEYTAADRAYRGALHAAERQATLTVLLGNCVFSLGYMGAVLAAALAAVDGRGWVGDVVLVAALGARVGGEISLISAMASALQAAQLVGARYRRLVGDARVAAPAPGEHAPPPVLRDGIHIRNLTFHYPGAAAAALVGVDLDLRPGETVALVGANGAGKSTLVKLLCRFYDPPPGAVTVDGRCLRMFATDAWRGRLAVAFQEPARMALTVREAIGVGDLGRVCDDAAATEALRSAGVAALLDDLPRGLDTELGDLSPDGVELSGGQWQQLALARAMMRREPLVILLDEPVSALDVGTETALLSAYTRATSRPDSTTIGLIVTHRLAAARIADRIVVLKAGSVVEEGRHDELVAVGGEYAAMFTAQARGYE